MRGGLHRTNLAALHDALAGVAVPGCVCLSDGFAVADLGHEQRAVIGGDGKSAAIAAASILAKETRDRYMHRADGTHPGWEFSRHVGYSTPGAPSGNREDRGLTPAPDVVSVDGLSAARAEIGARTAPRRAWPHSASHPRSARPRTLRHAEPLARVPVPAATLNAQNTPSRCSSAISAPPVVDGDSDHVEAQVLGVGPVVDAGQPPGRHAPHLSLLAWPDGLERRARPCAAPARLDLDEHECARGVDDQIQLAPPRAMVALQDEVAEPAADARRRAALRRRRARCAGPERGRCSQSGRRRSSGGETIVDHP